MSEKFEIIGEKYIGHMQGNAFVISNTEGFCIFIKEKGKEKTKDSWLLQKEIDELSNENRHLKIENEILEENEKEFSELKEKYGQLEKENEQLLYKLQQIEEYLQIKIDECKNHKKMEEIVFGVEQKVGYEKALLGFQKGLKRRLNEE